MKRFKHLVIGGIESKVLTLVLISMLVVAAVFVASMVTQNNVLAGLTQGTNEKQLASMTGTTAAVMDAVIVESPVGMPGRAVASPLLERASKGCRQGAEVCVGCIRGCVPDKIRYCINRALIAAWHGDWEHGLFFCGADVGKVHRMTTVREVIRDLMER